MSRYSVINIFSVLTLFFSVSLFAGTTGKIAGKVLDKKSNDAVIGANVIITNLGIGASADVDGNYFILNIPPGTYTLKISSIGYSTVTISSIKVSVDQTTKVDILLEEETIQLGEEVVVTATRPIVQKDLTSTESHVSGEKLSTLPVNDVNDVVNLQAGVVNGHFRGGRSGEVKYLIDGVAVNDVFSGGSTLSAEVNTIQEVQVLTGTFNAEYGDALSGVVNQVTKIGGENFRGNLNYYSGDYVSGETGIFQNINSISPFDVLNIQGDLSGPVPFFEKKLRFLLSGRFFNDQGFIYGKRIFNPADSSNFSANNPNDWYVGATGDGNYVPMNNNRLYSVQGKLSIDVGTGTDLNLSTLIQNKTYRQYDHRFQLNPDGDYNYFSNSYLFSANYTYLINNSSFLDFQTSGVFNSFKQYVYENPLDPRYVNPERMRDVGANSFLSGGTENWHFNHDTQTYSGKIDFTNQFDNINQVKTGIELQYHHLEYEDFQVVVDASNGYVPALPEKGAFNYNTYENNPYQFAAYIQDKLEFDYLVINAGLRFDYFEPDGKYLKNPDQIADLDALLPPFPDSLFSTAKAKYQLSPRIGISYPISEKGAVHISYGHFFQIPAFDNLYRNPNYRIPLTGDFPSNVGNSIGNADLKPQQTVMYEIGLQQEVAENIGVTFTTYYKDIRNLLATEIHIKNDFRKFSKLVNRDYGSVTGVTLSLEKIFSDGFGGSIDYTFQVAKGNASDPNDAFNKAQASPPVEVNKQLVPLEWDQRHSVNLTATFGTPGDLMSTIIAKYGSGLPYTPSVQNQRTGLENSDRKPATYSVDFYMTKYFNYAGYDFSAFLKIYNVFDTQNEINVFTDTGRAGSTLELTRNQTAPRGVNTLEEYYTRPDFYSSPRQVNIGLNFSF